MENSKVEEVLRVRALLGESRLHEPMLISLLASLWQELVDSADTRGDPAACSRAAEAYATRIIMDLTQ